MKSWDLEQWKKFYFRTLKKLLYSLFPNQMPLSIIVIGKESESIISENKGWIIDEPSKRHLLFASTVLGTYRILLPIVNQQQTAIDLIRSAFNEYGRINLDSYLEGRFGISKLSHDRTFELLSQNFRKRGEEQFGCTFVYEQEVQNKKLNFVNIKKCFFNDFFNSKGASELTPIFCSFDKIWANELNKGKYGVKVELPTVLGLGDDMCRYQFTKT